MSATTDQQTIRFTTQHGDVDTERRPILYVEGLSGGYVARGEVNETPDAYAARLQREGLPHEVLQMLDQAGLLQRPLLSPLSLAFVQS